MKKLIIILLATISLAEDKLPTLSAEQKLKLRENQIAVIKAQQELKALIEAVQRQMESLADYKQKKQAVEQSSLDYNDDINEILKNLKCSDCELDRDKLILTRRTK